MATASSPNGTQNNLKFNIQMQIESFFMYKIGVGLNEWYYWFVLPIGILGNFLSFMVTIQKHNRQMSFSSYISALAVSDTVALLGGLVSLIRKTYGLNVFGDPYWTCQVILVPFYGCSMCSTYFILTMTFERSYSITQPHKAASFNTVKRAKIIIVCIVVVFMIFNIPRMFLSEMEGLQCNPYGKGSFFWGRLYMYTELIISFIFPFISLLSMNCVIIHTLRLRSNFIISKSENYEPSQMEVKSQGQPQGSASKTKSAETQITVTLLVVTLSFLILTTPAYIILMLNILVEIGTTPRDFAMWFFLLVFGEKLFITNYAVNFFLYVISRHRFRADLVKLLICMRDKPNEASLSLSKITTLSEKLSDETKTNI